MDYHCMIDLETLGLGRNPVILSIGAVLFDKKGVVLDKFYRTISPASCQHLGLAIDASTVMWWLGQSQEARDALVNAPPRTIGDALKQLCDFMCLPISWGDGFIGIWGNGIWGNGIWGNGIKADIVWLESAYQAAGLATPWSYKQERCYRTFRAQHGDIPMPDHTGTAHNALDDALYQVDFIRNVCSTKNIEVL